MKAGWRKAAKHFGYSERLFVENYEQFRLSKTPYCTVTKVPRLKKNGEPRNDKKGKAVVDVVFKWNVPPNTVVVVDESHRCGAAFSQNASMLIALTNTGAKRLLLSGTVADSPVGLRAIGHALGLFPTPRAWFSFCLSHGCTKGTFGMEFGRWNDSPEGKREHQAKHMRDIHALIFGKGKGNRLCADQIPDFPKTSVYPEVIDFDDSEGIQGAYADMQDALSRLDEVEKKDRQGVILTEILRAKQRTEILKRLRWRA